VEQLPESGRWQMSILMDDFEESEMTQKFLKSLEAFSQSSARLVEVLNTMPQQMRTEMSTFLNESDKAQTNLQTTMKTAAETAARVEQMLVEFQKTTQAVDGTAAQVNQAAVAIKGASDSVQKLISMFQNDKPLDANTPPAFGMRDFDTMLLNAGQTADKIAVAVTQVRQAVESDPKMEIQKQLRSLIDHIAWRLFQLFLVLFVLFLSGRYLIRKCSKKT
jgi:DNA repair exonuclease SbcCD ATPase subunit